MKIRRQSDTFQLEEDPFSKNFQGIGKIQHEVLLLLKFLPNKSQVKNMNKYYYYLYYTIIENGDEKEIVNNNYEDKQGEYFTFNDVITPLYHIGRKKNNKEILKRRNLRSQMNQFKLFFLYNNKHKNE